MYNYFSNKHLLIKVAFLKQKKMFFMRMKIVYEFFLTMVYTEHLKYTKI